MEITVRTLSKALDIKGTRIIYKIDQSGKVQEIDTFLCGNLLYTENLPGGKPIDHKFDVLESIERLSLIPMNNVDDIFEIL